MSNVVRSAAVRLTMENAGYLRGAEQSAAATEAATGRIQRSVRRTALSTGRDWEAMGKYGGRYALAVGAGLAAVVKTTADFSSEMALVRTLSHANQQEMDALSKAALTVGQNIGYSAKEVAAGEEEMIKAGVSVKDILGGGLKGALDLAAAGQTDVATATTIAASAMTQFKLNGKDIPHLADLLSAGADKALGSVEDLGYGLEQSGTTAHQMGLSIEQTVGTLAAFAQAGLTGERGGTTFKQMLLQLAAPTSVAQKLMDKYGISLYNANGQIKTMPELAGNLKRSLEGLTPAQRNAALGVIFGSRAIQGANILMADGRSEIAKWISKVDDQGFAAGQASGKLDSLEGDLKKFKATLSTTFIQAGSPSQKALRELVQDADHLVRAFSDLPDEMQQGIVKVAALTAGIGATLYVVGKLHTAARELGAFGGSKTSLARGGLGRAASLAAPVPVFVTNLGAGGLGVPGKGGSTTVLGGAGKAAEDKLFGKIPLKYVGRGSIAVGLAELVLEGLGVGSKTHAGSTLSLGGAGFATGNPLLGIGGSILGAGIDITHAGSSTKNAITDAQKALDSGNVKDMQKALEGLNKQADKLAYGGWQQNFNRAVSVFSGRDQDIKDVRQELEDTLDEKKYNAGMLWLVSGGRIGKPPKSKAADPLAKPVGQGLDQLLNPGRKGGKPAKPPKPKTSEEVLADFYGINTKELKPVDLLGQITGLANDIWPGLGQHPPTPGKGHTKNGLTTFVADLGLDTSDFDKKAGGVKKAAKDLDKLHPNIKVDADTSPARGALSSFDKYLASLTRPRTVNVGVHIHKGSIGAGGPGDLSSLLTPADGVTVPGSRGVYGDRVPALLAPTEEVISNRHGQADRWRPLLKAINANRLADGGSAGGWQNAVIGAAAAVMNRPGASITVNFPPLSALDAAVQAADAVAADAAKVEYSAKDIRQQNLDDLHTQQQIRDLQHDLNARNKKHKLEMRGLDRKTAQAELEDAKANLAEIRSQKQADLEEARKAEIEALQEKRQEQVDTFSSSADIFARGTSPSSAIGSVDRVVADISSYGQVMAQLKAAGASPALLQQLVNRANTGDFRSAIRLGRALLAQPVTLGQLNASLASLGSVSSSVATMVTDPRFLSTAAWAPTSTNVVQVNLAADPSAWLTEVRRIVTFEVEAAVAAATR